MNNVSTTSFGSVPLSSLPNTANGDEAQRARAWAAEYNLAVAENERRERQTAALYELWRSVPHTETSRLLQRVAERVASAMDGHSCSLLLRERGGDMLRVAASVGLPQDVADSVTVLVGERIAGRVAATGQPILVNKDPRNHPMLSQSAAQEGSDIARRPEVESAICAPLAGPDGAIVGVLCVSRFAPATLFTDSDLRVVSLFAFLAGAVVTQVRTVEDLTRAGEEAAAMEREMARTSQLAALGEMAATVAHELRNPLSSIKGAAQYLLQGYEVHAENTTVRDFLSIVVEEVDGLGRLTTDLLEFSRPTPAMRERHDLHTVVRGATEFLVPALQALGVDTVHLPDVASPAPADVDAAQIAQALRNLLLNSGQAMQERGSDDLPGEIVVALARSEDRYHLSVSDNGPGVPTGARERLWEPFFTTKARGTGLGLSQVRRVAEAHGGRVCFEDVPGGGSRFIITIPASVA